MDGPHRFSERLKKLYSHWDSHGASHWGSSTVLTFATSGEQKEQKRATDKKSQRRNKFCSKGSIVCKWLFGGVLSQSIFVCTRDKIYCLSSNRHVSFFQLIGPIAKTAVGVDLRFYVKPDDSDGSDLLDLVLSELDAASIVGHLQNENPEADFLKLWLKKLSNRKIRDDRRLKLVDASRGFSNLFSVKDEEELLRVQKASLFTADVMQKVMILQADKIIKVGEKVSHSSMCENVLKAMLILSDEFTLASPPCFQSGERFDLKPAPSVPSNNKLLKYESQSVIMSSVGAKFKDYSSFIARTFLVHPTDFQRKAYRVLHNAHKAAICKLKPGNKLSDAYEAAVCTVKNEGPELSVKLIKHAGSGIGLQLHEPELNLDGKNELLVREGMVFNVSLGFQNLQSDVEGNHFSLWIADTVIVHSSGSTITTAGCSSVIDNITFPLPEVGEGGGERPSEFVVLEDDGDDDDLLAEESRKRKREMEHEARRYAQSEDIKAEAQNVKTQLDDMVKEMKVSDTKVADIKVEQERLRSANEESARALRVHQEELTKRLKDKELARTIESQCEELESLID